MKILLVGADGQLGRCIKDAMQGKEFELISCSREDLDITSDLAVSRTINKLKPEYVINAAAFTNVDGAEDLNEEAYSINAQGCQYLAKAVESNNSTLIHVSTDYVFDGSSSIPYLETEVTRPINVYGKSKLKGEEAIIKTCTKHIILRTSWVFSKYGNNFVNSMLQLARKRGELAIVEDQYGGPTYAVDIAYTIIEIISKIGKNNFEKWGVYHYSGSPYVSWKEFSQEIFKVELIYNTNFSAPTVKGIKSSEYKTKASRPKNSKLNCDKIENVFGIIRSDWKKALHQMSAEKQYEDNQYKHS